LKGKKKAKGRKAGSAAKGLARENCRRGKGAIDLPRVVLDLSELSKQRARKLRVLLQKIKQSERSSKSIKETSRPI